MGRLEKGFTLVEIMIVVIIIGILAALAVPNFISTRDTAYTNACQANLRQLNAALQMYRIDNGIYPNVDTWTALSGGTYLNAYMGDIPAGCPGSGTYSYNKTTGKVTCSATGHSVE